MQDQLREIEGTLARTSERKNTILYKLAKRKAEEERLERLGIKKLPTNPRTVTDVRIVKFALSQLKQETGDKIAKIRNNALVDLERDGEAVVRAKNDEINKLLARKDQWERRLCELTDKEWSSSRTRKKGFFGCAKQLPEALAAHEAAGSKRARESDDKDSGSSSDSEDDLPFSASQSSEASDDSLTEALGPKQGYIKAIGALVSNELDSELLEEEKQAERKFREANPFDSAFLAQFRQPTSNGSTYLTQIHELVIPEEAELAKEAVDQRKNALQQRLAALRANKS